ncbi:MAG: hypothetical protein ACR2KV_02760 [Solirubrobacteraceae bacterium]
MTVALVLIALVFGGIFVTLIVVMLRTSATLRRTGYRRPESTTLTGSPLRWIEWLISRK